MIIYTTIILFNGYTVHHVITPLLSWRLIIVAIAKNQ